MVVNRKATLTLIFCFELTSVLVSSTTLTCTPGFIPFKLDNGTSVCRGCIAGTYQTGFGMTSLAACLQCPSGTFQTGIGMGFLDNCTLCNPGTYQPLTGQGFAASCIECKAGEYQTSRGANSSTACSACMPGTYQPVKGGMSECLPCARGYYGVISGASSVSSGCHPCPPGTYQSALGAVHNSTCLTCATGTYQPQSAAESVDDCIWCPTGTYQPAAAQTRGEACTKCPLGTYQPGLAATSISDCKECRVGTYHSGIAGASSEEECLPCPAGTYQPSSAVWGLTACRLCVTGSYQPESGATSIDACIQCSAGTFQTSSGAVTGDQCVMCPAGTYQPRQGVGNSSHCQKCPSGTFQTGIGVVTSGACLACGQGSYSSGWGMGSEGTCLACQAGTYQPDADRGAEACIRCGPGTYQILPAQSDCTKCGTGTYQPFSGVSVAWWCKPCDPGTFGNVTGAATQASCIPCPAGQFSIQAGQTVCQSCGMGQYSPAQKSRLCFSCMSGTFSNTSGSTSCIACGVGESLAATGGTVCTQCAPGEFQFQNASRSCLACPLGKYQSGYGETACSSCAEGYFQSSPNSTGCVRCPPGFFSDSIGAGHCTPCAIGSFRSDDNVSTLCTPCGDGTFQALEGQTGCDLCDRGYYRSTPGPTYCTECAPGEFQTAQGSSTCDQCRPGTYRDQGGGMAWDSCFNCTAGTYSDTPGAVKCTSCTPGTYSYDQGGTNCFLCGRGEFQTSPGSSACDSCLPGTFSADYGLAIREGCLLCPLGTSMAIAGASRCDTCPTGRFSASPGAINCSECVAGTFMDEHGWAEATCFPCPPGTFSSYIGASSRTVCELCPDGFFSDKPRQTTSGACAQCERGTVSVVTKDRCRQCSNGELCPAGYSTPIVCVPGLRCNGTHLEAVQGMLPYLRDNCTGAIPCPRGTICTPLPRSVATGNQTFFIVFEGSGELNLPLSCPGSSLSYRVARLDQPPLQSNNTSNSVLFYLAPEICPAGTYLLYDVCTPCPRGTFSSSPGALSATICTPCLPGTFRSTVGGSSCLQCPAGGYCAGHGLTAWFACRPSLYQPQPGKTSCIECPPGAFASATKSTACTLCHAGWFQPVSGAQRCLQCQPTHFSSSGDHTCSPCGSNLASLDPGFSCVPPVLPVAREGVTWITVSGDNGGGSDQCVSTGSVPASALTSVNQVASSYVLMSPRPGACVSTLSIVDQPALSKQWVNQVGRLRRPVSIRVIPFNQTFYYDLCKGQGFSVLFTVADDLGELATDMTGASATMTLLDPSGRHTLFSMACERIPDDINAKVPVGVCKTTFCPTMSVWARVTIQWAQSLPLPRPPVISAQTLLSPGPVGACASTSTWMAAVELVGSTVPHFPGASFDVRIRVLNAPANANLAVFRFALRVLGGVTLLSVQSTYSVVTERAGNVVIVVGDASQGGGDVLATMRFRVDATTSGVALFAQVVPQSFQFTLVNAVPYVMAVRGSGFSCRDDGYMDILLDFPRATALIANRRRPYVINWRRIQASALDSPTAIHVIAVGNTMNHYAPVQATCTSLDVRNFDIASCDVIRGGNVGNQNGSVLVSYQTVTLRVALESWVPVTASFGVAVTAGGMSGRYRIRTTLRSGDRTIHGVDATPYLPALLSFGVTLNTKQGLWRCDRLGRRFTIGAPTMYTALCGDSLSPTSRKIPSGFFLVSGTMTGVTALGSYVFPPAVISGNAPTGTLLLFSPAGASIGVHNASLGSTSSRLSAQAGTLTLRNTGESARCVFFDIHPMLAQQWGSLTGRIPVFPGGPLSLDIALSASVILAPAQDDPLDPFMSTTVFVVRAFLVFSDGSRLSVQDDPRLSMASEGLDVSGLAATARHGTESDNMTLAFSFTGVPCVSKTLTIRVVKSSVLSVSLVCPACPTVISLEDDPLSLQMPTLFPSSFPQSLVLVRRHLADGRVVHRSEPLHVHSGVSLGLTEDGRVVGKAVGVSSLSSGHAPTGDTIDITVVPRWVSRIQFVCNGFPCADASGDLKLAPRDDGASLPPFTYSTTLTVSLSLTLFNGTLFHPPWLSGISLLVNGTESNTFVLDRLWYGPLDLDADVDDAWALDHAHGLTGGVQIQVERLWHVVVHGPQVLHQVHCAGVWEEGRYTATGTLSDGSVGSPLPAVFDGTGPLAAHPQTPALFHAVHQGIGTVTATFGGITAELTVHALSASVFFTGASLDSLPSLWTGMRGDTLPLSPTFSPSLLVGGGAWFSAQQLAARVIHWTSSNPSVLQVAPDMSGLVLLADWFEPVTVKGTFLQCDPLPVPPPAVERRVTVNMAPRNTGDLDVGIEDGPPLPVTPIGAPLDIPVFMYVHPSSQGFLQSYLLDLEVADTGLRLAACSPGLLPNSQCAVTGQKIRFVGAFSDSRLVGRILVGTARGLVLLDALAVVHITMAQCVVDRELLPPRAISYVVRLGAGALELSSVGPAALLSPRRVMMIGGSNPAARIYGDTDGDGFFTPMDVLFMEKYMGLGALARPGQLCVLRNNCQSTVRLSQWQLLQLKPVRNPNMPSTIPDGSDVLFLLLALVGKTFFLTGLQVHASAGTFDVRVDIHDYAQIPNPDNAVVRLWVITSHNRALAFDSPYELKRDTSTVLVTCRRVGPDDGFQALSLRTITLTDEPAVGIRIELRSLDEQGSPLSAFGVDRRFVFAPSGPIMTFNILGSTTTSPLPLLPGTVSYIPTLNCEFLCEDASLFIDGTIGAPEWLTETMVRAPSLAGFPLSFRGHWWRKAIQANTLVLERPSVTIPFLSDDNAGLPVGHVFNLTVPSPPPPPPDDAYELCLYTVRYPAGTGLQLIRAHGEADLLIPSTGPATPASLFLSRRRAQEAVELEFQVIGEGLHTVTVVMTDSSSVRGPAPVPVLQQVVRGVRAPVTSVRLTPWCTAGVILWSRLVSGARDQTCKVDVVAYETSNRERGRMTLECRSYPCVLQVFGYAVRPDIRVLIPVAARLVVQRVTVSVGHRTQWRLLCDMADQPNVTATESAVREGLITSAPRNALAISADSITGVLAGTAVVSFGNGVASAHLNVTTALNPPDRLLCSVFTSIELDFQQAPFASIANFRPPNVTHPLIAGSTFFLLVRAVYSGEYSLLLDPTPGVDGILVSPGSDDLTVSHLDGSILISPTAGGSEADSPLLEVTYQGVSATVRGTIHPLFPTALEVCCDISLAAQSSVLYGRPGFQASFVQTPPTLLLADGRIRVHVSRLDDSALRVHHDPEILQYNHSSGVWTLTPHAPASGSTVIAYRYTHPKSLVAVEASIRVTMVTATELHVNGPASLHRIHCSPSLFQSGQLAATLVRSDGLGMVDITDEMTIQSSQPHVAVFEGGILTGLSVGSAEITVAARGLSAEFEVTVHDESLVVSTVLAPTMYQLVGVRDVTVFPLVLNGTLTSLGTDAVVDLVSLASFTIDSTRFVHLDENHRHLIIRDAAPDDESWDILHASIPPCPPLSPVELLVSSLVHTRIIAEHGATDVEIKRKKDRLDIVLVSPSPVFAFFVQVRTDAYGFISCPPLSGMPVFSDCVFDQPPPVAGEIIVAGAFSSPQPTPTVLDLVSLVPQSAVTSLWGFVEVFDGESVRRFPIRAGVLLGVSGDGVPEANQSISSMMATPLPVVDTSVLSKTFRALFVQPNERTVRETAFQLALLVGRQPLVETRVYSSDFELSIIFFVMNRFLLPIQGNSTSIRVLFHSDRLQIPDSTMDDETGGRWVTAIHALDGLYTVELRQMIPVMSLELSFIVTTSTSTEVSQWLWRLASPVEVGHPLPVCPRSATQTATFLASYDIMIPPDLHANVTAFLQDSETDSLLGQVACSLQVATRRVLLQEGEAKGTLKLTVAMESLPRVRQANLILMGGWLADEFQRRLSRRPAITLPSDTPLNHTASIITIERGQLSFVNDTEDPPRPCPDGYFFSRNGTYVALPPHSVPGIDCYDMFCLPGFTAIESADSSARVRCIPTPVPVDIVWVCVTVILTSVLALAALACCVKFALWTAAKDVTDVMFDTPTPDPTATVLPEQPVPESEEDDPFENRSSDQTATDPSYFRNVVIGFGVDDLSRHMLMDEENTEYTEGLTPFHQSYHGVLLAKTCSTRD